LNNGNSSVSDLLTILGMSATLPNLHELAEWLDGETYQGSFRPVPLEEFFKINDVVYDKTGKPIRRLAPSAPNDKDHLLPLVNEVRYN
jgi:replicative superfamily II helicase